MNKAQRGTGNPNAKLSASQVRDMRSLAGRFNISYRALGRMFGIRWTGARAIVRGWSYKEVE